MQFTVPTHLRLNRERSNHLEWRRYVIDNLQASGDYGAISGERISDEESGQDDEDSQDGKQVKMEKTEKEQKAYRKKLDEQYAKRDARARTIIRNTIDMRAFEHSTIDCRTAQELWEKLQPTQAITEQEISRLIASSLNIEDHANPFDLVDMMFNIVNKAKTIESSNEGRHD